MNQQPMIQIQNDSRATIAVVLCQEFDFVSTEQFKREMADAIGGEAKLPLIVDLKNVSFMPSLALGALVELRNRFVRDKRPLTLVGLQPAIVKLLQTTAMLTLFDVRSDVPAAMPA